MDWSALFSTLGLIFVAELGDKTQLAVITQTCKHRHPWAIFLGASVALTLVTLIGALGGQVLNQFVPPEVLRMIAAGAFIVMGLLILREVFKGESDDDDVTCVLDPGVECVPESGWNWTAFTSTFGLLFVAELGDKTQLAVLSMASKSATPWSVFAGGSLALVLVTALGVVGGQGLCRLIPERILLMISAAAFILMGILMGVGIL